MFHFPFIGFGRQGCISFERFHAERWRLLENPQDLDLKTLRFQSLRTLRVLHLDRLANQA